MRRPTRVWITVYWWTRGRPGCGGTATCEGESAGRTLARSPGPHIRPPEQAEKAAAGEGLLRPQARVGLPAGVSALPGALPSAAPFWDGGTGPMPFPELPARKATRVWSHGPTAEGLVPQSESDPRRPLAWLDALQMLRFGTSRFLRFETSEFIFSGDSELRVDARRVEMFGNVGID